MDDFKDEEINKPIDGQMCYDELLLPEEEKEEQEPVPTVLDGQMDIWSLEPQNVESSESKEASDKSKNKAKNEVSGYEQGSYEKGYERESAEELLNNKDRAKNSPENENKGDIDEVDGEDVERDDNIDNEKRNPTKNPPRKVLNEVSIKRTEPKAEPNESVENETSLNDEQLEILDDKEVSVKDFKDEESSNIEFETQKITSEEELDGEENVEGNMTEKSSFIENGKPIDDGAREEKTENVEPIANEEYDAKEKNASENNASEKNTENTEHIGDEDNDANEDDVYEEKKNIEPITNEERDDEIKEEVDGDLPTNSVEEQDQMEEISNEALALHEKYEESLKKVEKRERVMEETSFYGDGGSGIITKNLSDVLHDSMIPYTEHVVMDRALPRVEDGLKPVQRRILYSMMELGLTPDKPYRKSARIVGDCMGKYHPHGDSSVYDAMVRMSQDFVLRAPLIDGHGNFGSVDGDSAAAMRYTEARMTPLALELLRDIEKDTVRWSLNFDDTLKEPDILPGRFPNLLVNGASGIAVGVATNIPPHNLGEVIDGVVAYINKPNITLNEMMKIIKGPDFPTGGELILGDGLKSAYETGKGKITIRAKVGIEQNGDRQSLVITELPYQVNKALLLQKIAELKEKNKDKLQDISEIRDESDRSGMRAIIRLKKDANAKKILAYLFQNTNMQLSYAINMVAIAGGKPKQMGLMEIISYYTAFQRDVIVRRTKYDLDVAKERAHIVEGLLIAIKNIDAVIKIIKTSANVGEAKTRLRAKFALSEKQAQAILDMRLARLVNLEVTKLQQELKELKEKIKNFEAILNSKKLQLEVVKAEILEIKRRFNSPRRSQQTKTDDIVLKAVEEVTFEDTREFYLLLTAGKTVKKVNMASYLKSNRTVSDGSTLFDIVTTKLKVKATDQVLILTEKGNCIKTSADKIAECKWRDKGVTLKQIDRSVDIMETPVSILPVGKDEIIMLTKKGMAKRMKTEDGVITKSYYQVLKVAEDDAMINAEIVEKGKNILMFTSHGFTVNFDTAEVPLQGRISGGVMGVNLEKDDYVVMACQNHFDSVMVITDNGYVKRLSTHQIPTCARYRKGVKYVTFAGNGKKVLFVGGTDKAVIDQGLQFKIVEAKKVKVSNDRLASGVQEVKQKVLDAYSFVD